MFKESTPRSRILVLIIVVLSLAIWIPLIIWMENNLSEKTNNILRWVLIGALAILAPLIMAKIEKDKRTANQKKNHDPKNHLPS